MLLCLMLLNVAVFSAQFGDDAKDERAARYYRLSVLYTMEPDLYRAWLNDHAPAKALRDEVGTLPPGLLDDEHRERLAALLHYDGDFLSALEQGRLVDTATPQGHAWQQARQAYNAQRRTSLLHLGAFVPREHRPHTFISSMFLHADPLHLVGNMVFLWLAGMLLEPLLGGGLFVAVYLATGLVSCAASWMVSPASAIPELGASGAVSGVTGALAAIYGSRRVPCLVNIGLHAWRTALQGYWLAVIWVAWEIAQWLLWPSNVNRMAHLGGLLAGAAAGAALRSRYAAIERRTAASLSDEDPRDRQRAKQFAANLNFEPATRTMLALAQRSQRAEDWALLWAYARHSLHSAEGRLACEAILAQRPPQGALRTTLLHLQALVRQATSGQQTDTQTPASRGAQSSRT